MKRLMCIIFSLLFLSGCGILGERIKEPVTFYYVTVDYQKNMDSVIGSEVREASGHRYDLPYLLALYSMGPSDEDLKAALPSNTRITPTEHTEAGIVLSISGQLDTMTDAEFTLASTCLAMTFMEITDTTQVTVISEGRRVTINTENVMTFETGHQRQPEVEE